MSERERFMSQKSVLIVDDSSSFRTVVKLSLMKAGYEVVEAVDGQDAVTKLDGKKFPASCAT